MQNSITINNQQLLVKEYQGKRVVTFKDIDTVHNRPPGTAGRNFRANRKHFNEGEDYYKIQSDEIRRVGINSPRGGIVVTESGYLMLVKSFTDDLSWNIQRQLVNTYFNNNGIQSSQQNKITIKYYNNIPILLIKDLCIYTGLNYHIIKYYLYKLDRGIDYNILSSNEVLELRDENPSLVLKPQVCRITIITQSGFDKIMKLFKQNKNIKLPKNLIPISWKNNELQKQSTSFIDNFKTIKLTPEHNKIITQIKTNFTTMNTLFEALDENIDVEGTQSIMNTLQLLSMISVKLCVNLNSLELQ